jgi:NADH:ubiquinone reductase (H+-translocating)
MAGELAGWAERNAAGLSVALVHGEDDLLTSSCRAAGPLARRLLEAQGVEVLLNTRVSAAEADHVIVESVARADGDRSRSARQLDCVLVIWAGGIRPASVVRRLGVRCGTDGWIEVDPSLRCMNERGEAIVGVFAGGDAVRVSDETGRWPTMNRAIECIRQAKVLAHNACASLQDRDSTRAPPTPRRHRLVRHFPYGISVGVHSLIVFRSLVVDLGAVGAAFRRWLMRRYFARYQPLQVSSSSSVP